MQHEKGSAPTESNSFNFWDIRPNLPLFTRTKELDGTTHTTTSEEPPRIQQQQNLPPISPRQEASAPAPMQNQFSVVVPSVEGFTLRRPTPPPKSPIQRILANSSFPQLSPMRLNSISSIQNMMPRLRFPFAQTVANAELPRSVPVESHVISPEELIRKPSNQASVDISGQMGTLSEESTIGGTATEESTSRDSMLLVDRTSEAPPGTELSSEQEMSNLAPQSENQALTEASISAVGDFGSQTVQIEATKPSDAVPGSIMDETDYHVIPSTTENAAMPSGTSVKIAEIQTEHQNTTPTEKTQQQAEAAEENLEQEDKMDVVEEAAGAATQQPSTSPSIAISLNEEPISTINGGLEIQEKESTVDAVTEAHQQLESDQPPQQPQNATRDGAGDRDPVNSSPKHVRENASPARSSSEEQQIAISPPKQLQTSLESTGGHIINGEGTIEDEVSDIEPQLQSEQQQDAIAGEQEPTREIDQGSANHVRLHENGGQEMDQAHHNEEAAPDAPAASPLVAFDLRDYTDYDLERELAETPPSRIATMNSRRRAAEPTGSGILVEDSPPRFQDPPTAELSLSSPYELMFDQNVANSLSESILLQRCPWARCLNSHFSDLDSSESPLAILRCAKSLLLSLGMLPCLQRAHPTVEAKSGRCIQRWPLDPSQIDQRL
jgi:hypothetical protein